MGVIEAIVLGLVQGITEFLPISSTAHLRIVPALLGWGDPGAQFSAVIQLGTVAAVLAFFSRDLVRLTAAFVRGLLALKPFENPDSRLAWFIGVGTLPIGILGLAFKKAIEGQLRSLYVIAAAMMLLAVVLLVIERTARHARKLESVTLRDALIVGCWQAVALIPGSSRSGTTIAGGLSLGFAREDAARFSFLLSIPATTLAGFLELYHLLHAVDRPPLGLTALATLVSFGSGMAAIAGLLRFLRTRSMLVFIVYRLVLGTALFALLGFGVLTP